MRNRTALELGLLAGILAGIIASGERERTSFQLPAVQHAERTPEPPATFCTFLPVPPPRSRSRWPGPWVSGRDLSSRQLPNGFFAGVPLRNVSLRDADLRGADFSSARLTGVDFTGADLRGARFFRAVYDRTTRWPAGFDLRAQGAVPASAPR